MNRFLRLRTGATLVTAFLLVVLFAMSADARLYSVWGGTPVRTMIDDLDDQLYPGETTIVTIKFDTPLNDVPFEMCYSSSPADVWKQALLDPPMEIQSDSETPYFLLGTNPKFESATDTTITIDARSGGVSTPSSNRATFTIPAAIAPCIPDKFVFTQQCGVFPPQFDGRVVMNKAAPTKMQVVLALGKGASFLTVSPPAVVWVQQYAFQSDPFLIGTAAGASGNGVIMTATANGVTTRGMLDIP